MSDRISKFEEWLDRCERIKTVTGFRSGEEQPFGPKLYIVNPTGEVSLYRNVDGPEKGVYSTIDTAGEDGLEDWVLHALTESGVEFHLREGAHVRR